MSRSSLRDSEGFILPTAIILLMVLMSIGLTVVAFADGEDNQSGRERTREASFTLSEAALQSQVFQLGRAWRGNPLGAYPMTCSAGQPQVEGCPEPAALAAGYPAASNPDFSTATCPAGTPTVAWTTEVRDNGGAAKDYYSRAAIEGPPAQPAWDANKDNKMWVRSTGVARCRVQTLVAMVAQTLVPQPFPRNAITAGWFRTTNNGRKVIVDTQGTSVKPPAQPAPQPAKVSVRCDPAVQNPCLTYQKSKGQVSPDTGVSEPGTSPTVSASQLESFRQQARSLGTYYGPGAPQACPPSLTGPMVFVETMNPTCPTPAGDGNSNTTPGFLVIANGSLNLAGNQVFYGVVYAANLTNLATAVVKLDGTSAIQGAVAVDGPGGVETGNSGANVVYDPRAFNLIKGHAGAGVVQNSWRVLPAGQ